jgi:thioredoxin 1
MKRTMIPLLLGLSWILSMCGCDSCCGPAEMSPAESAGQAAAAAPTVSLASFDANNFAADVLGSDKLVLADFFSPSCGVCRSMEPVVETVAQQFAGQLAAGKLNVDDNKDIAGQYNVDMIPQFLLFKNGEMITRLGGPVSQNEMIAKVQQALGTGAETP